MGIDITTVENGKVVEFYAATLLAASGWCRSVRHLERSDSANDEGDILIEANGSTFHVDVKQAMEWRVSSDPFPFAHAGIAQVSKFHRDWIYLIFSRDMARFIRFCPWKVPEDAWIIRDGVNKWNDEPQQFICLPRDHGQYFWSKRILRDHIEGL